jgi:hypothetical protein
MIAVVGSERDSTFHSPRSRPAWVRLRQRSDSLAEFTVVEVAPRRELLAPDSGSIVVRGRIALRERWSGPPPDAMAGHEHAAPVRTAGVIYPAVTELIPSQLHLDRRQIATLRATLTGTAGCAVRRQAVIANGRNGGVWVESVR